MLPWRPAGAAAAVVALVLGAAAARADVPTPVTPILIGPGYRAAVAVDASGTAHIAYDGDEPSENSLHYCQLPRGANACTVQNTLTVTQTSLEHPVVVVSGSTVQVVSYRYGFSSGSFGQDVVFTSHDGGTSFDGGVSAGQNPFYLGVAGPGNGVSTITNADSSDGGTIYQRLPLDGTSAGNTRANLSAAHGYEGAIGFDGGTMVATMSDASDNEFFRTFSGAGDPNDANSWTPEQPVGSVRAPHMAGGPSGLFLVGGMPDRTLAARKWTGAGFGAPVTIPGDGGETPQNFATEDPSGRLHVLLPQITANGSRLLYATSDDGGNWAARQFAFEPLAAQTEIAAAADHLGVAVWESGSGSTAQVFALPIGPSAAVPTVGKLAGASLVSGTVLVRAPGAKGFIPLGADTVIPVGSIVDATHGRVRITIAVPGGKQNVSDFYEGIFKLTQAKNGLATMVMEGGSFRSCGRGARAGRAAKSKAIRHLWGSGTGKFRTKGRFAAASIRGTTWDTIDRCDGTLVKVTTGKVTVTDLRKHKNVVVKKGKSYFAKA